MSKVLSIPAHMLSTISHRGYRGCGLLFFMRSFLSTIDDVLRNNAMHCTSLGVMAREREVLPMAVVVPAPS